MATEKKTAAADKSLSVEQRLDALYKLQTILSEIDRIKTLRGELPLEVKDLEDEIEGLKTRIQNFKAEAEELRKNVAAKKVEIQQSQDAIAKWTDQQNNVRNNKEFDFLAKEIGFKQLEIELCDRKNQDVAAAEEALEDRNHILAEKKGELSEIISETKQDEEKLREQAKKLEEQIEPRLLKAFKRIRSNARNGLGVVYVQRNACGGCFNRIPAQRQVEVKMHKKIIVCEYCGRILIDPALAGVKED